MVNHINNNSVLQRLDYKDNTLVFSDVNHFYKPIQSEGVSIKYVISGAEEYILNNKNIYLKENECFIANIPLIGAVTIDNNKNVEGICVNISYDLIRQIDNSLSDHIFFEGDGQTSILSEEIFEVFLLKKNFTGQKIDLLKTIFPLYTDQYFTQNHNLFFEIGEAFVLDQKPKLLHLSRIETAKKETKKEILKRLYWAREYLESNYLNELSLNDLSKIAAMSEYHFSRMFKQAFGFSPIQYQIKLRMEKSKQLLKIRDRQVSEVAHEVGYADIFSFSKAFKKFYGTYPSSFQN